MNVIDDNSPLGCQRKLFPYKYAVDRRSDSSSEINVSPESESCGIEEISMIIL
jgi:hypothetical protein